MMKFGQHRIPAMRLLPAMTLFTALTGAPVSAYENDVHYGLTKWLALKAGFTAADAETLAVGNRDVDGGALDAIRLVALSACMSKDVTGSELVLEHHFPSAALMPTSPRNREVKPGSDSAAVMSTDRLRNPRRDSLVRNLRGFGKGLHAFQDSFSHMGIPDIPRFGFLRCHADYAWGHPKAQGGWTSHNADLTPWRPALALKMAAASYDLMCSYRKEVQRASCASPWDALSASVEDFSKAGTKAAKWKWFQADPATRKAFTCDFLMEINLPDDGDYGCNERAERESLSTFTLAAPDTDARLLEAQQSELPDKIVEATLTTWFVKRDVGSLSKLLVNPGAFAKSYRLMAKSGDQIRGAANGLFTLWLHRDHGSVVDRLATTGNELLRDPVVKSMTDRPDTQPLQLPATARLVNYRKLSDAFYPVGLGPQLFHVTTMPCNGSETCALAAARLKKAPYGILLIEYRRVDGLWKIEGLKTLVDH